MLKEKNIDLFNIRLFLTLYPFASCVKETNDPICINVELS